MSEQSFCFIILTYICKQPMVKIMTNYTNIILLVFLLSLGFFFFLKISGTSNPNVKNISKEELKRMLSGSLDIQLVDVRTQTEVSDGKIANAEHIDYYSSNFANQFSDFDKTKPIYLYCRSGNRSGKAANILDEQGFKEVYNLTGGYMAWKR